MTASGAAAARAPPSGPAACRRAVPGARHEQAQLGHGHGRRAEPGDLALVHDGDPVGQGVDLVELGRDDDHRDALVALLDDPAVHELDRPDVQAPGGLAGQQQPDPPAHLAGQDYLLLVAAGQGADRGIDRRGPDVKLVGQALRVLADGGQVHRDPPGVRRPVVGVQHEVVRHREVLDDPVLLPVFGDVGDACPQPVPGTGLGNVPGVQVHGPRGGPQAHERLAELGLPVALHPGDAEDLPGPDLERDAVHRVLVLA